MWRAYQKIVSKNHRRCDKDFFYTFYRCQVCRFRFNELNSLRLIWFTVFAVLLIPIFGAIWMVSNEHPKIVALCEIEWVIEF